MKKVIVSTKENLGYGTLIWVNASNRKVYRSSKSISADTSFHSYDSHFMGMVDKLYKDQEKHPLLFKQMLEKSNRIFGVCLNKRRNTDGSKDMKVLFFRDWDSVQDFAENGFPKLVKAEVKRRKAAKQKWLERGKLFSETKKISQ
ncbi:MULTISPECIES: hypothetical protein [Oceanobacillus]|uniref:Uncharacterized protein n=1 Tax=Oceanobacillus profundus TaxID=372463 RepID=A0A417YL17_9BACI|nr:hypothetical protein [Oceanobacillus profundus]MBR3120448.1 hypothetical protein [Oceanobacillus sp.]PAE30206.1 hypothetical protein CHI07_05165 [Paenibacillus sp. 7884-2]MCM3397074.1 hypothetical protein [Oceanobacillus profundus]MDO6451870.1 hypothetical protein [Oceanobacillus profundus]RHW33843.1 hypothetical protein D1B32_07315 [Oceanobacillus profundus]